MTRPTLSVANGFVQLVTHVLAHVRLDQAGNLYDPRYLAWARPKHSRACRVILDQDADLLAQLWAIDSRVDRIHRFGALHDSLASFRKTGNRELEQLSPGEVADPRLLLELRGFAAAELLHASAALLDEEFEVMLAEVRPEQAKARDAVDQALRPLVATIPTLAEQRIELVWALGVHGRVIGPRVLVGTPASWNRCSPTRQAVLAAHEHLVGRSGEHGYLEAEWSALCKLSVLLTGLSAGSPVRSAHASWLAELNLGPILRAAAARGWIDELTAKRMERRPETRARTLAEL